MRHIKYKGKIYRQAIDNEGCSACDMINTDSIPCYHTDANSEGIGGGCMLHYIFVRKDIKKILEKL